MKKYFLHNALFLFFIMILSGCAVTYQEYTIVSDPAPAERRFVSFHQLQKGLTSAEAKAVLGKQVVIGYEMPDTREKRYTPVVQKNPYRVETAKEKKHTYTIEYYLAGINKSDGKVTDDELTPLVFENDKLIGWGWDFLNRIKD